MEGLHAQLRQEVSGLCRDELVMLLHNTAGQLVAEPSWAGSSRLVQELLNHARLLVESDGFCQELAQRFVETCKDKTAAMFADQEAVHRRFCDDTSRVTAWFDTFSMEGMQHFGPGARALANYCLRERASVWSCLQWKRRPVAPVTATRRPVLFCELVVVPTIEQLLREDPHFLLSRDLTDACRCAAWISCSTPFFAQETERLLGKDNSRRLTTARLTLSRLLRAQQRERHVSWCLSHMPQGTLAHLFGQCFMAECSNDVTCSIARPRRLVQEHSIRTQMIPFSNAHFCLAFGTTQWSNFDDLLLAFACLYHSPRLRGAAGDKSTSFLTNVLEHSQAVHKDFMKLLERHSCDTVACSKAPMEPKKLLNIIVAAFGWEAACCHGASLSMLQEAMAALKWRLCKHEQPSGGDSITDDSDADPLLLMQGGKRSRKRKRRDKGKEKEMVPTAGSTGAQEALNAGEKSPQHREAPNSFRDVTEYREST